jgi:hypothetical protein
MGGLVMSGDPIAFLAALTFLIGFIVFIFRGTTQTYKGINKGIRAADKWCDKQLKDKK